MPNSSQNSLTYALEVINNMAITNTRLQEQYFNIAELITGRVLTQEEIRLGAQEILFLTPTDEVSRFASVDSATFTGVIPANDSAEHLIADFLSPFTFTNTLIPSGPWSFGIPAMNTTGGVVHLVVRVYTETPAGDLTEIFSKTSPMSITVELDAACDCPVLQEFISTQPDITVSTNDRLRIKIFATGSNPVDTTILIKYNDTQKIFLLTPFNKANAAMSANALLGVGAAGIPGSNRGLAGDTHAATTYLTDPHGIVSHLSGGVTSGGDTLKKLYDLIIGVGELVGDFDASGGTLPIAGSGISGVIDKGDSWHITVAGALPGGVTPTPTVNSGDVLVARIAGATVGADFYVIHNTSQQATSTVSGIVKLYTNLVGTNSDGSVTQGILTTAINAINDAIGNIVSLTEVSLGDLIAAVTYSNTYTNLNLVMLTVYDTVDGLRRITFPDFVGMIRNTVGVWSKAQRVAQSALTSTGGNIAIDLEDSNEFAHTLTENTTLANPTNISAGMDFTVVFTQHASAAKTLTLDSFYTSTDGTTLALSTTTGAINLLTCHVNTTTHISCALVKHGVA